MRRLISAFALLLASAFAGAAPVADPVPVAYVAVRTADAGLEAFKYLAPLMDKEYSPAALEAFLRLRTGGDLEGLDRRRPLGAYLLWPADLRELASFKAPVVLFAPVTDQKKFLTLLDRLGCKPRQAEGGLCRLTVPDLPELSLCFAHGHAFAAARPELLRQPVAPETFLPKGGPQNLLSAVVRVEQFPPDAAKAIDKALQPLLEEVAKNPGLAPLAQRLPGETSVNYKQRKELMERLRPGSPLWPEVIDSSLRQVRQAALLLDVDPGRRQLAAELALEPRPESALATACAYAGTAGSRCAPVAANAAARLVVHLPTVPSLRESAGKFKVEDLPAILRFFLDARWSDAVVKALQVWVQTVLTDGFDFCVAARVPKEGEDPVVLIGLKVQKGRKIDHLIRDAIKDLPAADKSRQKVAWNLERHARAHIHRFDEGPGALLFGVRDDFVMLGFDDKSLGMLREAFDAYDRTPPGPTPLLQAEVSALLLMKEKGFAQEFRKVVPHGDPAAHRLWLRLQGGKDLRLRFEASIPFLQAAEKLPD
jgi:hypothetical protein